MLHFIVPGEPQAWQRVNPRGKHGQIFLPKETRAAKETIAQYAQLAIAKEREECRKNGSIWHGYPQEGAFWLGAKFYLGTHAVFHGKRKWDMWFDGDLDNYVKTVLDATQGIIFHNDKQIRGFLPGTCKQFNCLHPQTHIAVLHETEIQSELLAALTTLPVSR